MSHVSHCRTHTEDGLAWPQSVAHVAHVARVAHVPKEGFLGSLAYLPEDIQKFNDATEAPVTRFDTGGLLADLEIFELEAQSGDGVSPVSERLSPPSVSNSFMLARLPEWVAHGPNLGPSAPPFR